MLPTPEDLSARIDTDQTALTAARQAVYDALSARTEAERHLRRAEATALLSGLEGSNEPIRKANLAGQVRDEQDALDAAEDALTRARLALDLAEIGWNATRQQVRLVTGREP